MFRSKRKDTYKLGDIDLWLPKELASKAIHSVLSNGSYEQQEAYLLSSIIQPDEVIMEIGAGIGYISTLCAKYPQVAAVHAFEANPELIPVIERNHEINNVDVTVYNEIVGKVEGPGKFYLHESFWASSTTFWEGSRAVDVPLTLFQQRLDEIKPTMLIVDIEGGEVDLFDDIDLSGVQKIFLELHLNNVGRKGIQKLFRVLGDADFHYDQWHSQGAVVLFSSVDRF